MTEDKRKEKAHMLVSCLILPHAPTEQEINDALYEFSAIMAEYTGVPVSDLDNKQLIKAIRKLKLR